MAWFSLALIGPFLYAVTNYIDKIALDRYFARDGAGPILILSALFSVLALPFLFLADPTVFDMPVRDLVTLGGVGILNALVLFFYLKALETEEVPAAIIFYQLMPVFAYGLAYLVLGEHLTGRQIFAMVIITAGTSVVSIAPGTRRLRWRTILYMTLASFCWALGAVVFKAVALEEEVVRSLFWEHAALSLVGLAILIFAPRLRATFLTAVQSNSWVILTLGIANEGVYIAANVVMAFAYLMAPVSLVLLANSFQAFFALLIGSVLSLFVPHLIADPPSSIARPMFATAVTAIGTFLLVMPSG